MNNNCWQQATELNFSSQGKITKYADAVPHACSPPLPTPTEQAWMPNCKSVNILERKSQVSTVHLFGRSPLAFKAEATCSKLTDDGSNLHSVLRMMFDSIRFDCEKLSTERKCWEPWNVSTNLHQMLVLSRLHWIRFAGMGKKLWYLFTRGILLARCVPETQSIATGRFSLYVS
jgi:hypothetical protein